MRDRTPPAQALAFLLLLLAAPSSTTGEEPAAPAPSARVARRPNILWIVAENIDLDLGCYGETLVRTPNVDRLAAEGVRYTRVFATSPVCAPSRSAFMTGHYQTSTGTHNMRSHRSDDFRLPPGVRPITHRLAGAGYFTANITRIGDDVVGTGKLDLNFVNEGPIYMSDDWSSLRSHQPFFATISTPEVEYDIYDRRTAGKDRVPWVGEDAHPRIATEENVTPPPYYPDHPLVRREWARYLNSVSGLDRRVGRVLDALRRDGLEDDTVIIFFADNGRLEARGIHWCYDSGLHVPLIIRWPRNFPAPPGLRPGSVDGRLISLLDLTATTLSIAGIERPPGMQSRIFLGEDADPPRRFVFSARDRIDETVNRIRSVRGARYHYIRNFMPEESFFASLNRYKEKCFAVKPLMRRLLAAGELSGPALALMAPRAPPEELYDTGADPHEIHNLAESQRRGDREALVRLRAALETWMAETGDLGGRLEPLEVVAPFEREMHEWFGTPGWVPPPIEAGAAAADITPPVGWRMSGYFSERFSTGVHDLLHARALVLRQGGTAAALVFCDLIGISPDVSQRARREASRRTGIPAGNIVVAATHSHTGPLYFGALREHFHAAAVAAGGVDPHEPIDYAAFLSDRIAVAIVEASERAAPAWLSAGMARQEGLSFNRRFHMEDGSVRFNPGKLNPRIVRPAGPIDPDVGILLASERGTGKAYAALTVFALHLDTVGGTLFSADYPLHLGRALRRALGDRFAPIFGTGTCGDINHIDVSHDRPQRGQEEARRIGETLAATVLRALPRLDVVRHPALAVRRRIVRVALQEFSAEEAAGARRDMAKIGTPELPFLDQVRAYAISAVAMRRRRAPELALEVQVIRISSDVAVVALPGEIFVELGLAIKKASPFETTIVVELAGDAPGYIPTERAFREGSYETVNSRIEPGGGERLVEAAAALLQELAAAR